MPEIPKFNSRRELTTEPQAPKVNPRAFGSEGQSLQILGDSLLNAGNTVKQIANSRQYASAEAEAQKRFLELEERIATSRDLDGLSDEAEKEVQSIINETSQGISDLTLQSNFRNQIGSIGINKLFNMRTAIRKRELKEFEDATNANLEILKRDAINAITPAQQALSKEQIEREIRFLEDSLAITKGEGLQLRDEVAKEIRIGGVFRDAELNSDQTISELQKGQEGRYIDLTPEERSDLLDDITDLKKKNLEIAKLKNEAEFNRSDNDIAQRVLSNDITIQEIDRLEVLGQAGEAGGISGSFAAVARRSILSASKVDGLDRADRYSGLLDELATIVNEDTGNVSGTFAQVANLRARILKDNADGVITDSTADKFISLIQPQFVKAIENELDARNDRNGVIGKVYDWVTGQTLLDAFLTRFFGKKESEDRTKARMNLSRTLMNQIIQERGGVGGPISEERITQITNEVIDDFVKGQNPNRRSYEVGQIVNTAAGAMKVVGFDVDGEPLVEPVAKRSK